MSHPASENNDMLGSSAAGSGEDRDPTSAPSSSKADTAKEQGQQVKDDAVEGGKHVAGVAAAQGQSVLAEAGDQAQDLMGQARSQLASQAATQQENLTAWLRSLADELHQMVDRGADQDSTAQSESPPDGRGRGAATNGVATSAVSQAQGRVKEAADWLEKHEPSELVDEATRFARRRPGAFLAVAAVGGLLVGRFTRGLKDDASASTGTTDEGNADVSDPPSPGGRPTFGHEATGQAPHQHEVGPDLMEAADARTPPAPSESMGFGSGDPVGQGPR